MRSGYARECGRPSDLASPSFKGQQATQVLNIFPASRSARVRSSVARLIKARCRDTRFHFGRAKRTSNTGAGTCPLVATSQRSL